MIVPVISLRAKIIGPDSNGTLMSAREFDRADFEEGWRYELINGVLIVSPIPLMNEVDPNDELGHLLREYRDKPGATMDLTVPERNIRTGENRRRADRVIWAGLGRQPRRGEVPTIVVEFVSGRKRDRKRDYETKREEYLGIGVKEYWIFDRFSHTLTVFSRSRAKIKTRVLQSHQNYKTALLPGFEVPLAQLFTLADSWQDDQPD